MMVTNGSLQMLESFYSKIKIISKKTAPFPVPPTIPSFWDWRAEFPTHGATKASGRLREALGGAGGL